MEGETGDSKAKSPFNNNIQVADMMIGKIDKMKTK
jgi:hypothetical protein